MFKTGTENFLITSNSVLESIQENIETTNKNIQQNIENANKNAQEANKNFLERAETANKSFLEDVESANNNISVNWNYFLESTQSLLGFNNAGEESNNDKVLGNDAWFYKDAEKKDLDIESDEEFKSEEEDDLAMQNFKNYNANRQFNTKFYESGLKGDAMGSYGLRESFVPQTGGMPLNLHGHSFDAKKKF